MITAIEQKITKAEVVTPDSAGEVDQMHEKLKRPSVLDGRTYKIKTPLSDHALYITICDMVVGGQVLPREIFINSKNMMHYQWTVALTRVISAVFRKGGEIAFLVEELKSVSDPNGGYFKPGGVYMPSLVAEIGHILETHLVGLGIIEKAEEQAHKAPESVSEQQEPRGEICGKCGSVRTMRDGCLTCSGCGDSHCG